VTAVAATPDASPLVPGYQLDRYELLCPIAEGGMASVWVARQRGKHGFEKLVAIKTILPKFAADLRFQQMFLDEARIASRIEHANVAQILDLGEEHDVLYLAMEYVDGDALSKLNKACQRKGVKIPPGVIMRVLADACSGLHEAHELKAADGSVLEIVHRDVSPHNILVSSKGVAKVIDFGIAKARDRAGDETNAGVLKGKIQYMAPEQALGRMVDRRADVWAVGCVLYHLVAGHPPYEGENQLATLHLLSSGRPPTPLRSDVHPSIAAVVRKALTHAMDKRFATAMELREALELAMVDAKMQTTTADVAAFAAQHLTERAEKRRRAIDVALEAAAERRRVQELLKPTSDRTSASMPAVGPTGSGPRSVEPVSGPHPAEGTIPAVPDALAKLTARPSDGVLALRPSEPPMPGSTSYATIGATSMESQPPRGGRKGLLAAVIAAVVVLGVGGVATFKVLRPNTQGHAVAGGPPATTATASNGSNAAGGAPAGTAPGATASSGASGPGIPVVSLSALPATPSAKPPSFGGWPPAAGPRVAPGAAPGAPATATATTPARKKTIDDGF
jgi:serine/threonine protein kinase